MAKFVRWCCYVFAGFHITLFGVVNSSGQLVIYPIDGQSEAQQTKDEAECRQWAIKESGVDPSQPAAAPVAPGNNTKDRKVVKGAARGAVAGVAIGAIAGDSEKGAAIGAAAGGLRGVSRKRKEADIQQQNMQQMQAQQQVSMELYEKAYGACMGGRNYSVR